AAISNSATVTVAGSYESASTPTYAADSWSVQDVVGTGVNGASTLNFTHSGSTGTAGVEFPNNVGIASQPSSTYAVQINPNISTAVRLRVGNTAGAGQLFIDTSGY